MALAVLWWFIIFELEVSVFIGAGGGVIINNLYFYRDRDDKKLVMFVFLGTELYQGLWLHDWPFWF